MKQTALLTGVVLAWSACVVADEPIPADKPVPVKPQRYTQVEERVIGPIRADSPITATIKGDTGRVLIVGPNGAQEEVDLGTITVSDGLFGVNPVPQPQIQQGFLLFPQNNLWQSVEKKLKADGFTPEQLKKIKAALDAAQKSPVTEYRLPHAIKDRDDILALTVRSTGEHRFMIGVATADIEGELREELGLKKDVGVLVSSVLDEMPAKKAGVQAKDVIVSVNGKPIGKIEQLVEAVQKAGKDKKSVKLQIKREGKDIEVTVKPIERKSVALPTRTLKPADSFWRHVQIYPNQHQGSLVGPGIIRRVAPAQSNAKIEKQLQEVNAKLDKLQEAIDALSAGKKKRK